MQRVCFFYSGGTIGMRANSEGVLVPPVDDADFRRACLPTVERWAAHAGIEVTCQFITAKDSANMSPDDWQALILRVQEAQSAGYDAVAIAHGTDTMAYSAASVAFGMHGRHPGRSGLGIPVVFTGAQNSIHVFGGDGIFNLQNLFRTVKCCLDANVADVLINFGHEVLLGCRALKVSERSFVAFASPSEAGRVGYVDAYGVHLIPGRLAKKSSEAGEIQQHFARGIVVVDLGPGTEPGMLEALVRTGDVGAVVLKSPGEGNVCTEGTYNLLPFIQTAVQQYQVPVLIASKFIGGAVGQAHYEGGRAALDAGAIACFDTTDCAVEVKLRWLLGNGIAWDIESLRRAMARSYAGEVTE